MVDATETVALLERWMSQQASVLVAYSGGVDSAVLMAVARRTLGERMLACIGASPSYPERELTAAVELARSLGVAVEVVATEEHLDPRYAANPANRCYFCKSELFAKLQDIARQRNLAVIVDGNNASDVSDERPGWMAARERGVRSPLAELGITKDQVRAMAKSLGLPVWDKPSMPCLSSRVPHGTAIVPELLKRIERAEDVLVGLGFRVFRVRHHGEIARVEVEPQEMARALAKREEIVAGLKDAGYLFVTLDLAGFASGGLHRATRGAQ